MPLNIDCEIAELRQLTVTQLRARHRELCGQPAGSPHKEHLVRRIAWWLQALAGGNLSQRARRRADELVREADLRVRAPRRQPQTASTAKVASTPPRDPRLPLPGTILVRGYRGRTRQVKVLEQGFEYDGQSYGSLTAVTKQITGQHWNGYHFFGLSGGKNQL